MEELHILLTPNKEHKTAFPDGIGMALGLMITWLEESGRCEPCGKKTCLVYKYYYDIYRSMPRTFKI